MIKSSLQPEKRPTTRFCLQNKQVKILKVMYSHLLNETHVDICGRWRRGGH